MLKIFLVIMMTLSVFANKSVEGEGKFLAQDDDSLAFVKNQLLTDAFNKIIDQELKAMGLDSQGFWKNFEEKFLESFRPIEESVSQKYVAPEGQELKKEQIEKKEKELREKRLTAKAKFGRLRKVIKSYSIIKMSKSLRIPNSHYVNLNAQVDRKYLADVYYNFIGVSTVRSLQKLYIDANYQLIDTNWLELGVDTETDFTNVVSNHWKKSIEEKLSGVFETGITTVDDSTRKTLVEHLKKSKEVLRTQAIESSDDEQTLKDSLYLNFEVSIKKLTLDNELKKITLYFSGGLTLIDLKNNSVISFYDFSNEKTSFDMEDQHKLNSDIASLVYRLPAIYLSDIRKVVESETKSNDRLEIVLRNTQSVKEAMIFSNKLREKGVLFYFNTIIKSINKDEVNVEVSYSGDREKAIQVLSKMVSEKISDTRIVTKDISLPFVFSIDSLAAESSSVPSVDNSNTGI